MICIDYWVLGQNRLQWVQKKQNKNKYKSLCIKVFFFAYHSICVNIIKNKNIVHCKVIYFKWFVISILFWTTHIKCRDHLTFCFGRFIQSDLQYFQCIHVINMQYVCTLTIEPMTFVQSGTGTWDMLKIRGIIFIIFVMGWHIGVVPKNKISISD